MRTRFDDEMLQLKEMLVEMGAKCESAVASAIKALFDHDEENAQRAIVLEGQINQCEREIETLCLKLILRQQPVARDLRKISSALKMITDMERIGDHAEDITEIVLASYVQPGEYGDLIKKMALTAVEMVTGSIDAYVQQDIIMAEHVIAQDDIVDSLFEQAKNSFATSLGASPEKASQVVDLLMIVKYLERIGDHAVNIAEWVIFAATGVHPPRTSMSNTP